jgi:hypothetical protein
MRKHSYQVLVQQLKNILTDLMLLNMAGCFNNYENKATENILQMCFITGSMHMQITLRQHQLI